MSDLLTPQAVAVRLAVSKATVYQIKDQIGFIRIGGQIRFREENLERYLTEREKGGRTPEKRVRLPRLKMIV